VQLQVLQLPQLQKLHAEVAESVTGTVQELQHVKLDHLTAVT
jgi:hypothetical protein